MRDQSSWGNDTNPFCCDRCWENSPFPGPPDLEPTAAPPTDVDDSNGEVKSSLWVSDAKVDGRSAQEATGQSKLGDTEDQRDGEVPAPSLNSTVERGDRLAPEVPPIALLESIEEDSCVTGSVRGAGVHLEERGNGALAQPPLRRKADAVAAAFSAHLRGVDKYPLELARLCRFAQFLTENELLREAYEVSCVKDQGSLHRPM